VGASGLSCIVFYLLSSFRNVYCPTIQDSIYTIPPAIEALYRAETADMALLRLAELEAAWGQALSSHWADVAPGVGKCLPFFAFAPAIGKMIYTTNAVDPLDRSLTQDHQDPRPLPKR
jgi:transposase-like protein